MDLDIEKQHGFLPEDHKEVELQSGLTFTDV